MIVGFQMTYRLKTHFIDEYRDKDYGGLLRRVMWILSLFTMFLFVSTFLWLVFKPGLHEDRIRLCRNKGKSVDEIRKCDALFKHDYPGVELFLTFLLSNFVPTMFTPLTMVFGYIRA